MNPTQLVGLLAFGGAAIACARAARVRRPRLWVGLAALLAGLALEVMLGLRHAVHDLVDSTLQLEGRYDARGPLQWALIATALSLAALSLWGVARLQRHDRHAMLACAASAALLWLFVIETISLHSVDAIVYAPAGPVKLIAWLWAAAAAVVAVAASQVRRESARAPRR